MSNPKGSEPTNIQGGGDGKINWGEFKFGLDWLAWYYRNLQIVLTVYIAVVVGDLSLWWVAAAVLAAPAIWWFDVRFVRGGELGAYFKHNPEWEKHKQKR